MTEQPVSETAFPGGRHEADDPSVEATAVSLCFPFRKLETLSENGKPMPAQRSIRRMWN